MQKIQGYNLFQWPWSKNGAYSNMACGVSLALRARLFRERDIRHVYTPPQAIAGRAGGVRARRNGLYD
eukprot:11101325-Heterocapsa_arctica.AAC.1